MAFKHYTLSKTLLIVGLVGMALGAALRTSTVPPSSVPPYQLEWSAEPLTGLNIFVTFVALQVILAFCQPKGSLLCSKVSSWLWRMSPFTASYEAFMLIVLVPMLMKESNAGIRETASTLLYMRGLPAERWDSKDPFDSIKVGLSKKPTTPNNLLSVPNTSVSRNLFKRTLRLVGFAAILLVILHLYTIRGIAAPPLIFIFANNIFAYLILELIILLSIPDPSSSSSHILIHPPTTAVYLKTYNLRRKYGYDFFAHLQIIYSYFCFILKFSRIPLFLTTPHRWASAYTFGDVVAATLLIPSLVYLVLLYLPANKFSLLPWTTTPTKDGKGKTREVNITPVMVIASIGTVWSFWTQIKTGYEIIYAPCDGASWKSQTFVGKVGCFVDISLPVEIILGLIMLAGEVAFGIGLMKLKGWGYDLWNLLVVGCALGGFSL